ncbi:MAG: biotin carboxylase N-terminal domain-containing protein, partial [Deltaproteobacteria bacterium]|nr:biotin carboxylase N-terminal domain-containing protein [Deltaproteobacteria bacterium]
MPNLLTDYLTEHAADFERFRAAYNLERDADPAHFVAAAGRCVRLGEQSPPDLLSFAHGFLSSYHETEDPKRVLAAIIQSQEIPPGSVMARQQPDPHLALVNRFGGNPDRVIRSVLIANNGMAAKRIIDSLRAYAQKYFGNPYAIRIIAMATPEDKALGLSYIREADEVVNVPPDLQQGMGDAANYANVDLIRRIAVATGADAVHPGWGHASEQAELAKAIEEEGLIFMGPSAPLMSAHGDKIRALLMFQKLVGREMMSDWSGSDVAIGDDLEITAEDISKSCVNTVEEAVAASEALGFPVMLKAAGAGGGRGMKECYTEADLRHAWDKVVKQGGGSNIFVERLAVQRKEVTLANARQMADAMGYGKLHLSYLGKNYLINGPEDFDHEDIRKIFDESAYALSWVAEEERLANSTFLLGGGLKHIEVQVIADRHGQVVVLWPRDCSIQRNHQKVVEESAYTNPEIAKKLMRAAATIAKAKVAGESYSGLATVEFLVNEETGKANFLEVNTRVQVEHPVTEEVTDLNFLEIQTLISQGVPLHHIKEVRDYFNADPESRVRVIPDLVTIHERTFPTSPIDFDSVMFDKKPEGHVIALRIIAEDPENFDSSSGTIQKITLPGLRGVTGYYSVREGGGKGSASDAQIGHIFIHGKDRQEAITKALQALDQITVFGQIKTNIPLLKQILKHPEYVAGTAHNASLERWVQEKSVVVEKAEPHLAAISSAMVRAAAEFQRRKEAFLKALSKGQVPSLDLLKTTHRVTSIINGQKYEFMAHLTSPGTISLALMRPDEADAKAGKSPPRLIEDPDFTKHVEGEVTFEPDGAMTLSINNRRFSIHVSLEQNAERMEINGLAARIGFEEMDPTVLTFSAQARVIRIKVKKGEKVTLGQLLLVVEAAKEEKEILSDREGVIELVVSEGQVVSARDPLVRFELPPGEKKKETPYYTGTLNRVSSEVNLMPPAWSRPSLSPDTASDLIDRVMSGHLFPKELKLDEHFTEYFRYLSSRLALGTLLQNFIAERRMGMPGALYEELLAVAGNLRKSNP